MQPRRYRSDDRDLKGHDLDLVILPPDGNGDWYVGVWPHGDRVGPAVRVTTSGTPSAQRDAPTAVHHLYQALGGEPLTCSTCSETEIALSMEGIRESDVWKGISALGQERDEARKRAGAAEREVASLREELRRKTIECQRLARELGELEPDKLHAIVADAGAPGSIEVEPGGYRAASFAERVQWIADIACGRTPGDRSNARARAGAERVEAEQALARIPRGAPLIRAALEEQLARARVVEDAARAAEQAAEKRP